MRRAVVDRRTTETHVRVRLNLDGAGRYDVGTGIRFLDHMLELVARHGAFDLKLSVTGDLDVDAHHTVEDTGIGLGDAVLRALGTKRGINRAGYFVMPMDETLAVAAIDFSGRPFTVIDLPVKAAKVGDLPTELVQDFFGGFAMAARGIYIRDKSSAPGCEGCVRITAGLVEHTRACLTALEDILASRSR